MAEHSISHQDFSLPSALGVGPVNRINAQLSKLYGMPFTSLSFGGSSGALLTLLTAVLPKLHPHRDVVLFDDICHQSAIGGLIFGRWKAVRLIRSIHPKHQTVQPLKLETIKDTVEKYGAARIAALILCDVWVSSPHKRGLTPSSLGCILTKDKIFAASKLKIWVLNKGMSRIF